MLTISLSNAEESESFDYNISGTAVFSNGPPVELEDIAIDCAEFEYDCHPFRGTSQETGKDGTFILTIEIDGSYDGAEILLNLLGETFVHIIDTNDSGSSGSITKNIDMELEQKSPPAPVFTGLGCAGIVFIVAFFAALVRRPISPSYFQTASAKNSIIVECPLCDGRLENHLLIRHLIVRHGVDVNEAKEIAHSKIKTVSVEE
ncbi:MAG: hypothetical protein CMA12_01885 [Euryarchaeota archaeon]|nr:hypothetical protein [Euryarchaeota archaeon]OUW22984.1 MAG: hypothetical protein CBD33_00460 [Euryarchaeota archaeon TMED173]